MSKRNSLTDQQETALTLLLTGKTQREVGELAGVHRETVTRWRSDPVFIAALEERRAELWRIHRDKLCALAVQAVDVIEDLMQTGSDAIRLRAATAVLRALAEGGEPAGPSNPDDVRIEQGKAEANRRFDRLIFDTE